jgi:hypothetical protein
MKIMKPGQLGFLFEVESEKSRSIISNRIKKRFFQKIPKMIRWLWKTFTPQLQKLPQPVSITLSNNTYFTS